MKLPIYLNFNKSDVPIGWVSIGDEYLDKFPELVLAPEIRIPDKRTVSFGLVRHTSYVKSVRDFNAYVLKQEESSYNTIDIKDSEGHLVMTLSEGHMSGAAYDDYYGFWMAMPSGEGMLVKGDLLIKNLNKFYNDNF